MSNLDLIESYLWLGNRDAAQDPWVIHENSIARILSICRLPLNKSYHPDNIKYLHIKLNDAESEDICSWFDCCYMFIEDGQKQKENVLVHCGAGVSRSATVVIAFLMRKYKWPVGIAYYHVKTKRPIIKPNMGFYNQLVAYENILRSRSKSDKQLVINLDDQDVKEENNNIGQQSR